MSLGSARRALALAAAAAGCVARPAAETPAPRERTDGYERSIAPFPVVDSGGRALELAFHGGVNTPRPQLVDIDGDGELDLFLQEMTGAVALFRRDGSAGGLPRFVLDTTRYAGLDVGEWYRFADVDGDGDLDLLTESPFSYIRYYRNDGSPGVPRYVVAADTLRTADGAPLFSDRQNIPQLGDLDCDGRIDLLVGKLDGTVARYEADQWADAVPRFELLTPEFEGIRIVGQQMGAIDPAQPAARGTRLHGANTMALADHDGDGDLDLFWGDFFEPGLLLIENLGSCAAPNFRSVPVQFPVRDPVLTSGYNAPAFGDLSGDGRLDLVMGVLGGAYNPNRTSVDNLYHLSRDASGEWTVRTRQLLPILDVGSESIPALVDVDGDGDLDLLLANKLDQADQTTSRIHIYENIGSRSAPSLRGRGALDIAGRYHLAPAGGDLDGDGRTDLLVGQWGASLAWYRRTSDGYALADSAVVTITRGSNTVPALGDLDADGDLDLLVGESSGWLNFYRNVGDRRAPRFEQVSDEWAGIRAGRRSAPALVDLDGDGDLDLLVGSERQGVALWRNTGTAAEPRFERDEAFAIPVTSNAVPAAGDLDGDGAPELVIGGAGGGVLYFSRRRER